MTLGEVVVVVTLGVVVLVLAVAVLVVVLVLHYRTLGWPVIGVNCCRYSWRTFLRANVTFCARSWSSSQIRPPLWVPPWAIPVETQ